MDEHAAKPTVLDVWSDELWSATDLGEAMAVQSKDTIDEVLDSAADARACQTGYAGTEARRTATTGPTQRDALMQCIPCDSTVQAPMVLPDSVALRCSSRRRRSLPT